ncbi:hypothetical protein HDK77DRAFT_480515 [Phyllosticta capitalensis]
MSQSQGNWPPYHGQPVYYTQGNSQAQPVYVQQSQGAPLPYGTPAPTQPPPSTASWQQGPHPTFAQQIQQHAQPAQPTYMVVYQGAPPAFQSQQPIYLPAPSQPQQHFYLPAPPQPQHMFTPPATTPQQPTTAAPFQPQQNWTPPATTPQQPTTAAPFQLQQNWTPPAAMPQRNSSLPAATPQQNHTTEPSQPQQKSSLPAARPKQNLTAAPPQPQPHPSPEPEEEKHEEEEEEEEEEEDWVHPSLHHSHTANPCRELPLDQGNGQPQEPLKKMSSGRLITQEDYDQLVDEIEWRLQQQHHERLLGGPKITDPMLPNLWKHCYYKKIAKCCFCLLIDIMARPPGNWPYGQPAYNPQDYGHRQPGYDQPMQGAPTYSGPPPPRQQYPRGE